MNQAIDAELRGVAKTNDAGSFTIANEVIAARLGQTLGLPVPAGVVAEHSSKIYYLSLDVSKEGKALPPIVPSDFVAAQPRLAAGAVVFDIWTANNDRHPGNISYDPAFSPPRATLFDHGHALLGTGDPVGPARLAALEDRLGCTGKPPEGGNRQSLLDLVSSADHLREWVSRVEALPDFVITDACTDAQVLGLLPDRATSDALQAWLQERRNKLATLISSNQAEFPAVSQWSLDAGSP